MRVFGPGVEAHMRAILDARSDLTLGCATRSKLVGDKGFQHKTVSFHHSVKPAVRRFLVASALKDFVKYDPIFGPLPAVIKAIYLRSS